MEEEEIFSRIRSAITLRSFGEVLHEKPDLYGPFWIATTLIVVIIAASSLLNFFYTPQTAYNFDKLSVAASLVALVGRRSTASPSGVPTSSQCWCGFSEDWCQWWT